MAETIQLWCPKAGRYFEIDPSQIPIEVYTEALQKGLESFMNRGMTKILTAGLEGKELNDAREQAAEVAEANVEKMLKGEVRLRGSTRSASKAANALERKANTLALQKARGLVREAMKRNGIKVSYVKASEITSAAKVYLADHPDMVEEAKAELAKIEANADDVDVSNIKIDPAKVAAAEEKKKAAKEQLTALQAGKPKVRPQAHA